MRLSALLPPALAMWCGALACELLANAGELSPNQVSTVGLLLSGVVLFALALLLAWLRPRLRTARLPGLLAGACLGVAAAALHLLPLVSQPLSGLIEQRSAVVVIGVVESPGRLVQSERARVWQRDPQYAFRLASSSLAKSTEHWSIEVPMEVLTEAEPPAIGSLVQVRGRLSAGELPNYAAQLQADAELQTLSPPGLVDRVANQLRSGLLAAVANRPPDSASLVAGLAIGDQTQQSPALTRAMRTSGLAHLTAVSGGNVAVIVVLVLGIARLCRLRLTMQVTVCVLALAWFVVLVRPQPSVLRASVMGAVVLIGMLTGGRQRGTGVLAISIVLLMAIAPELAVSYAFALSVAATAGLIVWSPMLAAWLRQRFNRMPHGLIDALALTLTAQLATLPIIIAMGSSVGLAGIPANLFAMPVVPMVTVLGLLTAGLSVVAPPLAVFTGLIASWFASWIASVAYAMSALPLAVIPWPGGPAGLTLAAALLLGLLMARRFVRRRMPNGLTGAKRLALGGSIAVAMIGIWLWTSPRPWPMADWLLVACDVGQGDALVIRTSAHSAMLVDAGLDGRDVDRCLQRLGIASLDVVLLTHFHADHVGGLEGALHNRNVGAVFSTPTMDPRAEARRVEAALAARGIGLQSVRAGQVHEVGAVRWTVLWPSRLITAGSVPNNASAVILVESQGLRILLSGDVEPEAQSALMAQWPPVHADIAKIPHHGSRFQDPRFAQWTGARLALVSVGEGNDYGHPAASAIEQWQQAGAVVWRTDLQGSIAVAPQVEGGLGVVTERG